jgi:hypothetical protein
MRKGIRQTVYSGDDVRKALQSRPHELFHDSIKIRAMIETDAANSDSAWPSLIGFGRAKRESGEGSSVPK